MREKRNREIIQQERDNRKKKSWVYYNSEMPKKKKKSTLSGKSLKRGKLKSCKDEMKMKKKNVIPFLEKSRR